MFPAELGQGGGAHGPQKHAPPVVGEGAKDIDRWAGLCAAFIIVDIVSSAVRELERSILHVG